MQIKRLVSILLMVCVLFASNVSFALAFSGVDEWFVEEVTDADKLGLIPESLKIQDMSRPVTRAEFCETALQAYGIFIDKYAISSKDYFTDTSNPNILMAYEAGIVKGYEDGTFRPDNYISRQEMFKMIHNLMIAIGYEETITNDDAASVLSIFNDGCEVQEWAAVPSASLIELGVTKGTSDVTIDPLSSTSKAQAVVLAYRSVETLIGNELVALPEEAAELPQEVEVIEPAEITRNITYPDDFDSNFNMNPNLTITDYNIDKYILIFGSEFAQKYMSEQEAEANMVEVTVPVWRLDEDGTKISSTKKIKVNKVIEDITIKMFTEIFEGDEKFPINSLGCYSWRSGTSNSSHKWGIAFDINPTQNYYINSEGTILSGEYWNPGVDELSIPEESEVIAIFKKYGFAWGGDAWPSSKDYMHFSYFSN